ncbi:MAG: DUF11 domain-containing protein [Phaeodactylibacter sp.]|nr:DUF11 domain-containing protein [Phaeodactylibacter sp.]MCB9053476.1 DUF11 domain-containing protein [Lewinellaceae bacterium]
MGKLRTIQQLVSKSFRQIKPKGKLSLPVIFIALLGLLPVLSLLGGSHSADFKSLFGRTPEKATEEVAAKAEPARETAKTETAAPPATMPSIAGGGDYSIDFSAYDPITYNRLFPTQIIPPVMRNTGTDPLEGANHCIAPCAPSDNTTVESLAPEDLALGQIVAFDYYIEVGNPPACNSTEGDCITIVAEWNAKTTSGGDFGYDTDYGVFAAFIDPSDPSHSEGMGIDAKVTSFSYVIADEGTNNERIVGTIEICGLDPADQVVVLEVWVVLQSEIPEGTTGNVQSRLVSSYTSGTSDNPMVCDPEPGENITTSAQTIPLLRVREFFTSEAGIEIVKSDDQDPVNLGSQLTYSLTVTNNGPAVANDVVVSDNLDANTTFVSVAITDNEGYIATPADCSEVGGVLTCDLQFLNPGETVVIQVTVQVSDTAPYAGGGGTDCSGGGPYDLINNVTVATITDDPDKTNNADCEPTDVNPPNCGDCVVDGPDGPVCRNTEQAFTVDPTLIADCGTATVVWSITGNGAIPNPSTGTSVTVTAGDVCSGSYTITATVTCSDCAGDVECSKTININTPNQLTPPPNGSATVDCPTLAADPGAPADITDACGRMVSAVLVGSTDTPDPIICDGQRVWTYRYTDCAGNTADWTYTYTIADTSPPSCPPALGSNTLTCADNIPNPAGLLEDIQIGAADNCPGAISSEIILDSGPAGCVDGSFGRTYIVQLTDACGLSTECTFSFSGSCEGACTLTQGGWGNAGGKYPWNNEQGKAPTLEIITFLLEDEQYGDGELVLGDVEEGNSLTITNPSCILVLLPGGGKPQALPGPGAILNGNNLGGDALANEINCVPYQSRYHQRNGRIKNVLIGNAIALQLNIWYSEEVNGVPLGDMPLNGICMAIEHELPDTIVTIQDLMDLANQFLSGQLNEFPELASIINDAVTAVNEFWDECEPSDPPAPLAGTAPVIQTDQNANSVEQEPVPWNDAQLTIRPNPASDEVELAFPSGLEERALIRVMSMDGEMVRTEKFVTVEGMNYRRMETYNLPAGMYWVMIQRGENTLVQKLVIAKR